MNTLLDPTVTSFAVHLDDPIPNLTAATARECVKVFEGLPYSPDNHKLMESIAVQISRAARLGLTRIVVCKDASPLTRPLGDDVVAYLRSEGKDFQVVEEVYPSITSNLEDVERYIGYSNNEHSGKSFAEDHLNMAITLLKEDSPSVELMFIFYQTVISWSKTPIQTDGHVISREQIDAKRLEMQPELEARKAADLLKWQELRAKYLPKNLSK